MGELRSIRVLLGVRVSDGLVQGSPHSYVIRKICRQASVEIGRARLEMGCESPILHGQVVIFFFVHFFVDDILLGDPQRTAGASFVYFGCSTC